MASSRLGLIIQVRNMVSLILKKEEYAKDKKPPIYLPSFKTGVLYTLPYTRKNAQVVTSLQTSLFASCQQVVFALLVPNLL